MSSRELYKSNYSIIDMVKMKISSSDESEVLPDGKYGESAFAFEPEYTDDEVCQLLSQSHDESQSTKCTVTPCYSDHRTNVAKWCKCDHCVKENAYECVKLMLVF